MPVSTETRQMVVHQTTLNPDGTVRVAVRASVQQGADPATMAYPGGDTTVEYASVAEAPILGDLIDVTFTPVA